MKLNVPSTELTPKHRDVRHNEEKSRLSRHAAKKPHFALHRAFKDLKAHSSFLESESERERRSMSKSVGSNFNERCINTQQNNRKHLADFKPNTEMP